MYTSAIRALPFAHYDFFDDANDQVGSNDLTLVNSPVFTQPGPVYDSVQLLSASSQQLTRANSGLADFDLSSSEGICYWGWVYVDQTVNSDNAFYGIFQLGGTGNTNAGYQLAIRDTNPIRLYAYFGNGTTRQGEYQLGAPFNQWFFVVVRCDRFGTGDLTLSINAAGATRSTDISGLTGVCEPVNDLIFRSSLVNQFQGRLAHWGFSKTMLTDAQEAEIYNRGFGSEWETELQRDYYNSTARKVYILGKAAEIGGAGDQDGLPYQIIEGNLPDEFLDTNDANVPAAGFPTGRASLDELGVYQIPFFATHHTPTVGAVGARSGLFVNPGKDNVNGTSGRPIYLWSKPGSGIVANVAAHAYGRQAIPNAEFLTFFPFDDPTSDGEFTDLTSNENDATEVGTVSAPLFDNDVGRYIDFDNNEGAQVASGPFPAAGNDVTIGALVQPADLTGFLSMLSIRHTHSGTDAGVFFDVDGANDYFRFRVRDDQASATYEQVVSSVITYGNWYYPIGTIDDAGSSFQIQLYLDAVSQGTDSAAQSRFTKDGLLAIAHGRSGTSNVDFLQSPMRFSWVYEGLLTADQITTITNNHKTPLDFWESLYVPTAGDGDGQGAGSSDVLIYAGGLAAALGILEVTVEKELQLVGFAPSFGGLSISLERLLRGAGFGPSLASLEVNKQLIELFAAGYSASLGMSIVQVDKLFRAAGMAASFGASQASVEKYLQAAGLSPAFAAAVVRTVFVDEYLTGTQVGSIKSVATLLNIKNKGILLK